MKKRKWLLLLLTVLLSAYVMLYYASVSPYGPVTAKERIPFTYGWSPSYDYFSLPPFPGQPLAIDWNGYLRPFFNPIHQIDRVIRKDLWMTSGEKEAEIYRASEPLTPFTYDMAVVRVLSEPPPVKSGRRSDRLDLFGFDDGLRYHSFTNCTTANWKQNYFEMSKVLISKAELLNLDAASLQQALGLILEHSEDRIAYLPVSVHRAVFKGRLSWIIRVKWEYPSEDAAPRGLGHIRHFIFDQQNFELLDFKTCN